MPKRVIYIKNPSDGSSHFRTILGDMIRSLGGTGSPKAAPRERPKAPPVPRQPTTTGGIPDINTYMPGATPGYNPSWFAGTRDTYTPDYGTLPGYGIGPYQTEFTPGWQTPNSLAAQLFIIAQGFDYNTGNPIPRFGEPGWGYSSLLVGGYSEPFGPPPPAGLIVRRRLWYPFQD